MLDPSPLLADLGDGKERFTVYATAYDKDIHGNPVRRSGAIQATYDAIVTRTPATLVDVEGTERASLLYKMMIFSRVSPGVIVDQVGSWIDSGLAVHSMLIQGDAISAGPGAWQFFATEISPTPATTPGRRPADPLGWQSI